MKVFNIIGICLSLVIMPLCVYYVIECERAGWSFWNDYYSGPSRSDITIQAAGLSLLFTGFFVFQSIMNVVKVKTTTSKVMGIISISLIGIIFLINAMMLASSGGATYDEGGPFNFIAGLIMLAFSIVFLVQTVNYEKKLNRTDKEIIDDSTLDEIS